MSRDDVVGMGGDAPEGARVASHTVDSPGCACFKCCHCVCTRRPGLSPPPMLQSRRGAEDRAGRRFATYAIRPSHGFGLCNAIYLTRTITRHKTYSATYAEDRTDHGTRLSAIGVSITGMEPKSKSRTTARHTPPLSPEKLATTLIRENDDFFSWLFSFVNFFFLMQSTELWLFSLIQVGGRTRLASSERCVRYVGKSSGTRSRWGGTLKIYIMPKPKSFGVRSVTDVTGPRTVLSCTRAIITIRKKLPARKERRID